MKQEKHKHYCIFLFWTDLGVVISSASVEGRPREKEFYVNEYLPEKFSAPTRFIDTCEKDELADKVDLWQCRAYCVNGFIPQYLKF
jgi:hypothetical protein